MADGGSGALGEVGIDVYADLDRLEADFSKARASADRFSKDMSSKIAVGSQRATMATDAQNRAVQQLAKAYSPVHSAMLRYQQDVAKIQELQRAGIFNASDAAMFSQKAEQALRKAEMVNTRAYKIGQAARESIGRWSLLLSAAAAAVSVSIVKHSLEQAKAIADTSQTLGISTAAWQKWQYIATQSGVSSGVLENSMERLGYAIGRASTGAKRESLLFKDLGISLTKANGQAKNQAELLPELADKLLRVGNAAERAAALQLLFGENGAEMGKLLAGGSSRIDELSAAAEHLGIVLSDEQIQKADETAKKLEEVKLVLSAQIAGVVADNAGAITSLANALAQLAGGILKFWNSNPEDAAGVIGAIGGALLGLRGGLPGMAAGAIIGGAAGMAAGQSAAQMQRDMKTDPKFRKQELDSARATAARMQKDSKSFLGGLFTVRHTSGEAAGTLGSAQAEVARQEKLYAAATAKKGGGGTKPAGGNISLANLNAPKGRTSRPRSNNSALQHEIAFENELAGYQTDILRSMQDQAKNADQRAVIANEILDIDKGRFERTLKLEGPEGTKKFTAAEEALLRQKYMELDAAKRAEIERQRQDQNLRDKTDIENASLQNDADLLEAGKSLARSQKQRKEIELNLLELTNQIEINKINERLLSSDLSDTEKKILEERKLFLEDMKQVHEDLIREDFKSEVDKFLRSINMGNDEVSDALDRIRATALSDRVQRAGQFADDMTSAFGNAAESALELQSPLKILKGLLTDLAKIFNQEVLVRPFQDMIRKKVAGPLAERVVGAPAGAEGLWTKTLATSGVYAAEKLDALALAATRATQGFSVGVGGGGGIGYSPIPGLDLTGSDFLDLGSDFSMLSDSSTKLSDVLMKQVPITDKFGSTLNRVLQSLSSGPTGGGGGFLKTVLGFAAQAFGSGGVSASFRPSAALVSNVSGAMAEHAAIFHDGGEIGLDARPVRRRLKPDERHITARVGERVIRRGPSQRFADILDSINEGRLPNLGMPMHVTQRGPQYFDHRTSINGPFVVPGAGDERAARRAGRQFASALGGQIARAAKTGIVRPD